MSAKLPAVYILSNRKNGVLYTGVTSNLAQRIHLHKSRQIDGFSKKYNTSVLVYYELHSTMYQAIIREKQLKKWRRDWKVKLIEKYNNLWQDLYFEL